MCAYTHAHTDTCAQTHMHESTSASPGCRNRILEPLKIISDIGHEWLMSIPEHNIAHSICRNYLSIKEWLVCWWSYVRKEDTERQSAVVLGSWLCWKSIQNWDHLCKSIFHRQRRRGWATHLKHSCRHVDKQMEKLQVDPQSSAQHSVQS